jgi:hypothetical protein
VVLVKAQFFSCFAARVTERTADACITPVDAGPGIRGRLGLQIALGPESVNGNTAVTKLYKRQGFSPLTPTRASDTLAALPHPR